ncbi:MAG: methyltransferase domain-containing protein [Planctomycetes bacterium]|nr:methyltransferase domain-containing protein [Planctomycetota bacterium]
MSRVDPATTRAHWDALAADYDRAKARNDAYYVALKRLIADHVPVPTRDRILEVGCGTGQILAELRPREGLGIDASPRMIEVARERAADRPELSFRELDAAGAEGLGEFDAVVSSDLLEHVDGWRQVVSAMVAACRPGGVVVITTPSPTWSLPLWVLEKLRLKMPEGPHAFVHRREIARSLEGAGCEVRVCGTHLILPIRLAGLGPRISTAAARLPLLRALGVIQLVVATKPAEVTS